MRSSGRTTAVSGRPSPSITSRAVIGISRPAKMFTAGTMRLRRGSNARGSRAERIALPRYFRSPQALKRMAERLAQLPAPCALFCNNDWESVSALNAADLAGIPVPDGIAVVGVGNEELICTTSSPPLSSIETRLYLRGLRAAEELDRVMEGAPPRDEPILVEPGQVVERASSDFFAVGDRQLRKMLEYLRKHAASPVQVAGSRAASA